MFHHICDLCDIYQYRMFDYISDNCDFYGNFLLDYDKCDNEL